ncbi:chondroitin sulfate synthase 2-like [Pollicipes pollicipes]|uniref:chondroitin sulfate synthase 2-like n=1 Tax=Pollicipes pollicipes TaxID=41117 RepID=UPI001885874B|nr:chondroitin sulfate synthase 2-like [Pollicipes pollicipes]
MTHKVTGGTMGCLIARRLGISSWVALFLFGVVGGFLLAGMLLQESRLEEFTLPGTAPMVLPASGGLSAPSAPLAQTARDELDTFEPVIRAPLPNVKAATDEKFSRPRFYSTELGTHRKLYVAVLTSPDTVHTEARNINQTLAHITTSMGFFMTGEANMALPKNLHDVVIFPSEDMDLPLKTAEYLADHHGHLYDYFFVVRDSTYVRGYRLQELVEDLSVSVDVLLAGRVGGRCQLDGGLLMSRQVLMSVAGRRSQCEAEHGSAGQDRALIACLEQQAGLACSDHVQRKKFVSGAWSELDPASVVDQPGLVTVRGVHSTADANRLHAAFSRLEIGQIDERISELRLALEANQRNMHALSRAKNGGLGDSADEAAPEPLPWPAGSAAPVRTSSRHHINMWLRFSETHSYLQTPNGVRDAHSRVDKLDVEDVIALGMAEVRKSGPYRMVKLKAGYRRFDGGRGMDYIMDLEVQPEQGGDSEIRRVEVHRPMLKAELVPMPFVTEKPTVTVVLPVTADQITRAEQFVQNVINNNENLSVVLYLIAGDSSLEVFRPLVQLVQASNKRSASMSRRMGWMTVKETKAPSQFFIMDAVSKKVSSKALILLFNEPALEYDSELFNRARMQTIRGWEIFCPIPWVEYHPDLIYNDGARGDKLEIHKNYGHFDGDFYGILSFYMDDYLTMREKTLSDIPRFHSSSPAADQPDLHPYDLYGAFLRHSGLHAHRAVDPSFRLYYFTRTCPASPRVFHQRACVNSLLAGIGSQHQLAEVLEEYRKHRAQAAANAI